MRKVYASFPGNTWCGLSLAALCPTDSPTPVITRAYPFGHSRRKQQYYWAAHTAQGRRKRPLPTSTPLPPLRGTFPVISRRVLFYATASPKASCQSWVWGRDKSGPYAQVGPSARAHRAQSVARRVSFRGARAGRASG